MIASTSHRSLRYLIAVVLMCIGTASGSVALADNWTTSTGGRISSGSGTKIGIGFTSDPAAQVEVRSNTSGREAVLVNQINSGAAIARFTANGTSRMILTQPGNLGIGTTSPTQKLHVVGNVHVTGFVNADGGLKIKSAWSMEVPDYVFSPKYKPMELAAVEAFVKTNRHLPEIPSAAELNRDGMNVAEMNLLLLKKVEELTLYVIEQDKRLKELAAARQ